MSEHQDQACPISIDGAGVAKKRGLPRLQKMRIISSRMGRIDHVPLGVVSI